MKLDFVEKSSENFSDPKNSRFLFTLLDNFYHHVILWS